MNQREQDELIEVMALAMANNGAEGSLADVKSDIEIALRAANERGFDLCKLPNKLGGPIAAPNGDGTHSYFYPDRNRGWSDCLNAVEVVRIGEGDERL